MEVVSRVVGLAALVIGLLMYVLIYGAILPMLTASMTALGGPASVSISLLALVPIVVVAAGVAGLLYSFMAHPETAYAQNGYNEGG